MKKLSTDESFYEGGFKKFDQLIIEKINHEIEHESIYLPKVNCSYAIIHDSLPYDALIRADDIVTENGMFLLFVSFHGLCVIDKSSNGYDDVGYEILRSKPEYGRNFHIDDIIMNFTRNNIEAFRRQQAIRREFHKK